MAEEKNKSHNPNNTRDIVDHIELAEDFIAKGDIKAALTELSLAKFKVQNP